MGVYTNNAGLPDALVYDTGTIANAAGAFRSTSGASIPLSQGLYWLAFVASGNTNLRGQNSAGPDPSWMIGEDPSGSGANPFSNYQRSFTFGALPNPFGSGTYTESNTARIWLKG